MPAIIRQLNYDEATILMVDSNLQREVILHSERAKAYKMKLEALKRQGARNDLTSVQLGQKLSRKTSRDQIADGSSDNSTQILRYLRLNYLISYTWAFRASACIAVFDPSGYAVAHVAAFAPPSTPHRLAGTASLMPAVSLLKIPLI